MPKNGEKVILMSSNMSNFVAADFIKDFIKYRKRYITQDGAYNRKKVINTEAMCILLDAQLSK